MNIIIMGVPDAGKSSVGKELAKKLKREFIDTDTLLEKRLYPESLTSFFVKRGEEAFRKEEYAVLDSLKGKKDLVISLGGGTPTYVGNQELIKRLGKSIFLKADLDVLLYHSQGKLPGYLNSLKDFEKIVNYRTLICEQCADLTFEIGKESVLEVTEKVMEYLCGQ